MNLEVKQLGPGTWELFIDGAQTGQYNTAENLGLRIGLSFGIVSGDTFDKTVEYKTDVPLFASGTEAAKHGLRRLNRPPVKARKVIESLTKKRAARNRA